MNRAFKLSLLTLFLCSSNLVIAAGFYVGEHSAQGTGRANAGEAAFADTATTISTNPAGMARLKSTSFSVVSSYVDPGIDADVTSTLYQQSTPIAPLKNDSGTNKNVIEPAFVPGVYLVKPINDKFAIGGAIYSNFGVPIKYETDIGALIGGETNLTTLNYNLSLSYRINDQFSVGAGINLIQSDATFVRHFPNEPSVFGPRAGASAVALNGDATSYGFNLGILWEINADNRLGLSYVYTSDIKLEGTFRGSPASPGNPMFYTNDTDTKLTLDIPTLIEFSGYHKVAPRWAIHYSVLYTDWNSFQELLATESQTGRVLLSQEERWENTWRLAIGTTYDATDALTLRVGYAFDQSPVRGDAVKTLSLPDSDRNWFTAGASYKISKNVSVDFAIAYLQTKSEEGSERKTIDPLTGTAIDYQFSTSGDAFVYSAQFNYTF